MPLALRVLLKTRSSPFSSFPVPTTRCGLAKNAARGRAEPLFPALGAQVFFNDFDQLGSFSWLLQVRGFNSADIFRAFLNLWFAKPKVCNRMAFTKTPGSTKTTGSTKTAQTTKQLDTEYDRAKVPPYSGNDPPPAPRSLKGASLSTPIKRSYETRGRKGYKRGAARNFLHSFPKTWAKGDEPRKVPRSTFLEAKGASKKVSFPFGSKRKGTF